MDDVAMKTSGLSAIVFLRWRLRGSIFNQKAEEHHSASVASLHIPAQVPIQRTVIEVMVVINIQFHALQGEDAAGRVDMAHPISLDPVFADRHVFADTQRDSAEPSSSGFSA